MFEEGVGCAKRLARSSLAEYGPIAMSATEDDLPTSGAGPTRRKHSVLLLQMSISLKVSTELSPFLHDYPGISACPSRPPSSNR
jgi:hypothetical protein